MARRRIAGGIIPGLFLAASVWAQTAGPSVIAIPPQPLWSELTVPEKIILTPLADEWDSLEPFRRKKWLGIAESFSSLSPKEQRRLQGQMQEWHRLTPEAQRIARANYQSARRLSAVKRQELKYKWEEYSRLPAEEKERLKKQASGKPTRPLPPTAPARARLPTWDPGDRLPPHILPLTRRVRNQMSGIRNQRKLPAASPSHESSDP
jgi:hypothetical protein